MTQQPADRPRFRFSADRQSAWRRVRYVESNHPDSGNCTICQLDELANSEQVDAVEVVTEQVDSRLSP